MADNAGKLRRQRDTHRALGKLLAVSSLPAISWTIPTSGMLIGDVDRLMPTEDEPRQVFAAWVRQLGANPFPERAESDGVIYLYAKFRIDEGLGVRGAIRATIYPSMDDEGGDV
jgi:hypothetical protein